MFKRAMYAPEGAAAGGAPEPESTPDTNPTPSAPTADSVTTPTAGSDGISEDSPSPSPTPTDQDPAVGEFSVPDEYKDAAWATKVKSEDDLWKQLANTQTLLGRKHATPDFATATPEQIEQYFNEVRPETPEDYAFAPPGVEDYEPTDFDKSIGDAMHKAGISGYQGNLAIQAVRDIMLPLHQAMYDKDAFLDSMEEAFGRGYEAKVGQMEEFITNNLNDGQREQLSQLNNSDLKLVYQLANNIFDAYGAAETNVGGRDNPGLTTSKTMDEVRSDLRKEIKALDKNPNHTAEQKQTLVDKLHATYVKKG